MLSLFPESEESNEVNNQRGEKKKKKRAEISSHIEPVSQKKTPLLTYLLAASTGDSGLWDKKTRDPDTSSDWTYPPSTLPQQSTAYLLVTWECGQ